MRPSECAEKIASTTTSSAVFAVWRDRCCRGRTGAGAAVCATGARDVCGCGPPALLRAPGRPWRGCGCGGSGSSRSLRSRRTKRRRENQPSGSRQGKKNDNRTYTESRPRGKRWNLPKPKPPSLGWPRSFTPQPLTASIQLRTSASSRLATKSKKGRPRICVVDRKLSLEQ